MVVMSIVVGVVALLGVAAVVDQHRRRAVLEATIPAGRTRANRRVMIRTARQEQRAADAQYQATHQGFGGGGEFQAMGGGDGGSC